MAKVTKRPEQIDTLPKREFNLQESLLHLKQQKAGLEPGQKHDNLETPLLGMQLEAADCDSNFTDEIFVTRLGNIAGGDRGAGLAWRAAVADFLWDQRTL